MKDGAKRKQLLSNSEDGFCNDNLLLDMLLGRAFLQLFVIRHRDAAGNEAVQFIINEFLRTSLIGKADGWVKLLAQLQKAETSAGCCRELSCSHTADAL